MNFSYHDSTHIQTSLLDQCENRAKKQEQIVLDFFRNNRGEWTPAEVWKRCLPGSPLTSVRRAITNLTTKNWLVKCDLKRNGIYGHENNTWKLR